MLYSVYECNAKKLLIIKVHSFFFLDLSVRMVLSFLEYWYQWNHLVYVAFPS